MASNTEHFGLKRLQGGDNLSDNGYQFTDQDRITIDALLHQGVQHVHNGSTTTATAPSTALTLTLLNTAGSIPAGTRVYYKYTLVTSGGLETVPSIEYFKDTAAPIVEPAPPSLSQSATAGSLLPGNYYYILTAYTTVNTQETKGLNSAYITVPVGTSTNRVILTMPTIPTGATGFNIYRKKPGGSRYDYLSSVLAAAPTYTDTGGVLEDCNRTLPISNSTNATNSIQASIGTVPVGMTWKLYRTYQVGNYINALAHWVVEETSEGSGVITGTYVDAGQATTTGTPPSQTQVISNPPKVKLLDAAEVQGRLPLGSISAFPVVVEFHYSGPLAVVQGAGVYVLEFPKATVKGVRATLGRGSFPSTDPVLVDVNKGTNVTNPVYTTIFTTQTGRPTVLVNQQRGVRVVPDVTELVEGESLSVDIDQTGTAETARDITVTIYLWVYGFNLISHPLT